MIKKITHNNVLLAIIGYSNYTPNTTEFLTSDEHFLQMGFIKCKKNHEIQPHQHLPVKREFYRTNEFLFIREGKVSLNMYSDDKKFLETHLLQKDDWVLLLGGSHGFDILENTTMIEVKNGPYAGDMDKLRFDKPK